MKTSAKVLSAFVAALALASLFSCNGGNSGASGDLQSQVDSLTAQIETQNEAIEYYEQCFDVMSGTLDSMAVAEGLLVQATNVPEESFSKESFKETLNTYASILKRQKEDIANLQKKLDAGNANAAKLNKMIALLNKQIAEKDAKIAELKEIVDSQDFTIATLQMQVEKLSLDNTMLKNTVASQNEKIEEATDKLNEVYYIVGSSADLKASGLLSQKLLGKKKIDVDNMQASKFTKMDSRTFKSLNLASTSAKLMTQHPASSYRIEVDKASKSSTLYIINVAEFWSISKFLIVQL